MEKIELNLKEKFLNKNQGKLTLDKKINKSNFFCLN